MTYVRQAAPPVTATGWTCPTCKAMFNRSDTHKPGSTSCEARRFAVHAKMEQLEQVYGEIASTMYQHKLVKYRPGISQTTGKPSKTCAYAPAWAVAVYNGLRFSGDFEKVIKVIRGDPELQEAVCAVLALTDLARGPSLVRDMLAERGLCTPALRFAGADLSAWMSAEEDT